MMYRLLRISRPRFWHYLVGTYTIGILGGMLTMNIVVPPLVSLLWFAWWTFPANLLIYGINDIHDYDTDRNNPKKQDQEILVHPREHRQITVWLLIALSVALPLWFVTPWIAILWLLAFLFLGYSYSSPPLRTKVRPGFDSLTNILYIVPGIFGYSLITGVLPPWQLAVAGMLWSMAMHAYSAVPDIPSDSRAGIATLATSLGTTRTLLVCTVLYALAMILVAQFFVWESILLVVYPLMMIKGILSPASITRSYWWFPWINGMIGMLYTLRILWELYM